MEKRVEKESSENLKIIYYHKDLFKYPYISFRISNSETESKILINRKKKKNCVILHKKRAKSII